MHLELLRTTSKIVAFAKSGQIVNARKLFDEMSQRDSVAWNAMLSSYSQMGIYQEALALFWRMRLCGTGPDHFTFTATLSACAGACDLRTGTRIHALIVILGYRSFTPVNNALIDMYGKCFSPSSATRVFREMRLTNQVTWCSLLFAYTNSGHFESAHEVFSVMPRRTTVSWNTVIAGHARHGDVELCSVLMKEMMKTPCVPDQWTVSALVNACSESSEFQFGSSVHCFVVKTGLSSFVEAMNSLLSFYARLGCRGDAAKIFESIGNRTQVSWNAVIDANMKSGDAEGALLVFRRAPENDIVSWTCMISGYARNGPAERALGFFVGMTRNGIEPDDFAFGAVLHACSSLAMLGHGEMVHGSLIRRGFEAYAYVGNGLVNMYAKCGDLGGSSRAFSQIPRKDLVSWNAMLFAFGLHGAPGRALEFYEEMVRLRVKPDKVTFIGLFVACSHSGLLEKSREIYETMRSVHGLSLETDHVMCVVDMLCRGGYLAEAKELSQSHFEMSGQDIGPYESLLGASSEHRDVRSGKCFGKALRDLEPNKEMSYVLLSNLYCASGQWNEAEMVREAMVKGGVKKMPGCSWIEVRNKVTSFVAGDSTCPHKPELCQMLCVLEFEMRSPCFVGFMSLD